MHWADHAIKELAKGKSVYLTPRGSSMKGRVESGQTVLLAPPLQLEVDDIVLVKVSGSIYLHLIKAIRTLGSDSGSKAKRQYQIGNNRGGVNGWANSSSVYGVVTFVGDRCVKQWKFRPQEGCEVEHQTTGQHAKVLSVIIPMPSGVDGKEAFFWMMSPRRDVRIDDGQGTTWKDGEYRVIE